MSRDIWQQMRGTKAALNANAPKPYAGEVVHELDTGRAKIGDGVNEVIDLLYTDPTILSAHGNGIVDDYSFLESADLSRNTITIPPGVYKVSSNITLTGDYIFLRGAVLKPDNGVTITFLGLIYAGFHHIFDRSAGGEVVFSEDAETSTFYPQWWGIVGDGVTDNGGWSYVMNSIPTGSTLFFKKGRYVLGGGSTQKELNLVGEGKRSILIPNGESGAILYLQGTSPSFLDGVTIRNLTFDGDSRSVSLSIGAVRIRDCQRMYWENVWFRNIDGTAIYFQRGVRNNWFHRVYIDECGNGDNNQPHIYYSTVTSGVTQGGDGHNNNYWTDVESLYPHGDHIRCERFSTDSAVRNNFFTNCMFHGGNESNHLSTNVVLNNRNGRNWYFTQCRFHSTNKGWPLFLNTLMPSGSTINSVILQGVIFGGVGSGTESFTATTGDNLVSVDHGFQTGALVRLTGGGLPSGLSTDTDYYVIRVDADTFQLAEDRMDAEDGTQIDIGDTGSGDAVAQECFLLTEDGDFHLDGTRFEGATNRADILDKTDGGSVRMGGTAIGTYEGEGLVNNSMYIADTNGVRYRILVNTDGSLTTTVV